MTNPEGPDLPPEERAFWLKNLLHAAEAASADLHARNDVTQIALVADLDDLCIRLRGELDDIK